VCVCDGACVSVGMGEDCERDMSECWEGKGSEMCVCEQVRVSVRMGKGDKTRERARWRRAVLVQELEFADYS
jgi:hypothetical protein